MPELERLGHEAIAIDMPGHGERVDEESTAASRLDAVMSVLQSLTFDADGGMRWVVPD